jgi:hypothetical protein
MPPTPAAKTAAKAAAARAGATAANRRSELANVEARMRRLNAVRRKALARAREEALRHANASLPRAQRRQSFELATRLMRLARHHGAEYWTYARRRAELLPRANRNGRRVLLAV